MKLSTFICHFLSSVELYSFFFFAFINIHLNSLLIIYLQFLNDLMNHCYLIIMFMLFHSALMLTDTILHFNNVLL